MAPSKGMIEELANIDQRLSALEAKFDSFSNAQKQDSGTAIKQLPCQGCQRIFGSAQGLASHLTDS